MILTLYLTQNKQETYNELLKSVQNLLVAVWRIYHSGTVLKSSNDLILFRLQHFQVAKGILFHTTSKNKGLNDNGSKEN
ncbi:hypothetical protein [Cyclobacterium qasimii]|uniref:Uncharacterized protein n=1 Tax=Cyclobacterium qasimii M12-11B TaxID=641524 RepID=S7V7Z6_9BACT|nr:hypothetical protein [Cyclobacterium qasimii]EPR66395.1 hypothetical protein ADICYQ_4529 [Cyclobacterium qasimii M12-11B]